MAELADIGKALFGDDDSEVVKSGTLAVTRFTGWVGAIGLGLTNTEVFGELSGSQKLWGSIAILAIFAFIAAADSLARGYVTGSQVPAIHPLDTPMKVIVPAKSGPAEKGWRAIVVRFDPQTPDDLKFWVVKGSDAMWLTDKEIEPE